MNEQHHRQICEACLKKEYDDFRHACVHESMARNEEWCRKFNIGTWPQWYYDAETEVLLFTENGNTKVVAEIVTAGLVHNGTWEWSWGNPNVPARSREMMEEVRRFGELKEWSKLTTLFIDSDEYLGWEFSAISAHLLNAEGVYSCPLDKETGLFAYVLAFETKFVN